MQKHALAIDAGTTGITALILNDQGEILGRGYEEFEQYFPEPGWVEHDPEQIWQATLAACESAISISQVQPDCIGITNQRETLVLWDKDTLASPTRAIVWQDRRTAEILNEPKFQKNAEAIQEITGLRLDPYFTSSKLLWVKRNLPQVWNQVESGRVVVGTVDSYLVARISGGRLHVTDASNASRTQLCDIRDASWHPQLLELFEVPQHALPKIVPSIQNVGNSYSFAFLGLEVPITAIAGDQQAALFGQGAFNAGDAKCTYGTGAFMLLNTGNVISNLGTSGLLNTIAWQAANGQITYALEGSVFIAGAAVQWLRDGLQIIEKSSDIEALAREVDDSGGVVFVPALSGLGAPRWIPEASGTITGLTRGTTKAHIARATLDGIAWQVTEVFEQMAKTAQVEINQLRVDGGASANNLLLEIQASQLQIEVIRPTQLELTAIGIGFMALSSAEIAHVQEVSLTPISADYIAKPRVTNSIEKQRWIETVAKSFERTKAL